MSAVTAIPAPTTGRAPAVHGSSFKESVMRGSAQRILSLTLRRLADQSLRRISTMSAFEKKLLEKLKQLPAEKLAEVEDFVDFLASKSRREAAFDRLLAIAPALEAAGVEPMSEEEVTALIEEARAERRVRRKDEPPGASRP
jgi:hypothetical protein